MNSGNPQSVKLTKCNQKDKEDLEEISTELELADEDDKVPYESTLRCCGFWLT